MWLTFCNTNHIKMSCQLLLKKQQQKTPQVMDRVQATCFFLFPKKRPFMSNNIWHKKSFKIKTVEQSLFRSKTHCAVHFVQKNHHKNA